MEADQSTPISTTIELKIEAGEDNVRIEAGDVRYNGTRKALTNQGTGRNHVTRNVESSNQPRDGKDHRSNFGFRASNSQQRISGQDMRAGQSNITRYVNQSQHYGRMPKASTVQGRQVRETKRWKLSL